MDMERYEQLIKFGEEIKERVNYLEDIRNRDWMNLDTRVSKVLRLLIDAENLMCELDDYQLFNGQNYSELEDLNNQLAGLRKDYTKYIDNHKELITMDNEITNYYQKK